MPLPTLQALRGFLIDSPSPGKLRAYRDGAILIEAGKILDAGDFERLSFLPEAQGVIWQQSPDSVLIPGLIDAHTHLPQYAAVGREEATAAQWAERHIAPLEQNFTPAAAAVLAPTFYQALARHGTTLALIYTASDEESCQACFAAAETFGLRAILGKTEHRSSDSKHSAKTISEASRRLAKNWHGRDEGRLEYAITPSEGGLGGIEGMRGLAEVAREFDCYVQTHLTETISRGNPTTDLFPDAQSAVARLDSLGLLGPRTLLGNAFPLTDAEIRRLAESECRVVHCPTANLFLRNGLLPYTKLKAAGVKLLLGSDVAAGADLNLWRVMRGAIETQVVRALIEPEIPIPTASELFYLATLGAASALGKASRIGSFEPGKDADLVVLDLAAIHPRGRQPNLTADLSAEEIISLFVYRGGPEATQETWVRGRRVYSAPLPTLL